MARPIYDVISQAVVDGRLPDSFSLAKKPDDGGLSWADGAMDGVSVYHWRPAPLTDEQRELMVSAVTEAAGGNTQNADALFFQLGQASRALPAIDELQRYIIDNNSAIPAQAIFQYAMHLMTEATDAESVKFGLSFMELFNTSGIEPVKMIVRTLGLSDEFTLFAAYVMGRWPDGNEELFSLAQKVHGWGRIHLVERVEPETPRIRQWFLREGVHNDVMAAYSALVCWNKSGARALLEDRMSREDFCGVRDIIAGLLDEGPVPGISEIEDAADALAKFLVQAREQPLDVDDYGVIRGIRMHYEDDGEDDPGIVALCDSIIDAYEAPDRR